MTTPASPVRVQARTALTRGRAVRHQPGTSPRDDVAGQAALFTTTNPATEPAAREWLCPLCLTSADGPGQCPADAAELIEIDEDGNEVTS
jgi:hypothetical protein